MKKVNVAIIGCGPAGLFAAKTLLRKSEDISIVIFDKGPERSKRICIHDCKNCPSHDRCNMLCGIGGAGLYSDGKLVGDLHAGGRITRITHMSDDELEGLSEEITDTLRRYDGLAVEGPHPDKAHKKELKTLLNNYGLDIKFYDVTHMGTINMENLIVRFKNDLESKPNITIRTLCEAVDIKHHNDHSDLIIKNQTGATEYYTADFVLFAVGKTGSSWLRSTLGSYGVEYIPTRTYLGVRIEMPQDYARDLFAISFDPKIWTYYDDNKVKTHCFCRKGSITYSNYMGFPVVGGHTAYTERNIPEYTRLPDKCNFNILSTFDEEHTSVKTILEDFRQYNPDGLVVQTMHDFLNAENGTDNRMIINEIHCRYGNIMRELDRCDHVGSRIAAFIKQLSNIIPGILQRSNLVYAPSVEWIMDSIKVSEDMETSCNGWFVAGDGAGLSQGIVHAGATGTIAAEGIYNEWKKRNKTER